MRPSTSRDAALRLACALTFPVLALSLASCAGGIAGGTLSLEAEADLMPKLEGLLADRPLPAGWSLAVPGQRPTATLSLQVLAPSLPIPRGAGIVGMRYLAASADLAEDIFTVSSRRAEDRGLVPLESIALPRRALAVDGLWPGNPGYPFAQRLILTLRSAKSGRAFASLHGSIGKWLEKSTAEASDDPLPLDLAAAGDIQVGEYQWPLLAGGEEGLSSLLRGGVLALLRKPYVAVANLESPISARGFPNPRKRFRFRMPPGERSRAQEGRSGPPSPEQQSRFRFRRHGLRGHDSRP